MQPTRCGWCASDPLYVAYHDEEWGVPVYDDRRLFEMLILEGAQAGLSWLTILKKRAGYLRAFCGFDPECIARFDSKQVEALLADPRIVRNRLKVEAAVGNARAYLRLVEEDESLGRFLWGFVGNDPRQTMRHNLAEVPARTPESDAMSRALLARGFKFVGSTICYAFMQAVGMVNDHVTDCFRHADLARDA
ncbi:MAG: DNA-3-methyladenine glycosylase I [Burkholderiales bacterium]|jgi:DNA-3-methyladenine glycosylase I|nr:DNA-3-methyladenine glycosylase I [Burkholderiales bacterium]